MPPGGLVVSETRMVQQQGGHCNGPLLRLRTAEQKDNRLNTVCIGMLPRRANSVSRPTAVSPRCRSVIDYWYQPQTHRSPSFLGLRHPWGGIDYSGVLSRISCSVTRVRSLAASLVQRERSGSSSLRVRTAP